MTDTANSEELPRYSWMPDGYEGVRVTVYDKSLEIENNSVVIRKPFKDWHEMVDLYSPEALKTADESYAALCTKNAALVAYAGAFKNAWEEFQGEFYKAADLDKAHGGCYLITADRWDALLRKVNAVIGRALHSQGGSDGKPYGEMNRVERLECLLRQARQELDPPIKGETSGLCATIDDLLGDAPAVHGQDHVSVPRASNASPLDKPLGSSGITCGPESLSQGSAQANDANPLLTAALDCPHEIDSGKVLLLYDPKRSGNNALNQLGLRLDSAASKLHDPNPSRAEVKEGVKPLDPAIVAAQKAHVREHVTPKIEAALDARAAANKEARK